MQESEESIFSWFYGNLLCLLCLLFDNANINNFICIMQYKVLKFCANFRYLLYKAMSTHGGRLEIGCRTAVARRGRSGVEGQGRSGLEEAGSRVCWAARVVCLLGIPAERIPQDNPWEESVFRV